MKTRLIVAAVGLPVIIAVILFLPPAFLTVMTSVITACCAYELLHASCPPERGRIYLYPVLAAVLIPVGTYLKMGRLFDTGVVFLLMFCMFFEAVAGYKKKGAINMAQILMSLFAGALIPSFLSVIVLLKLMENGRFYVLLVFITTMVSDSGAYFIGVFFGKHRGITAVSPNKSMEGFIGSIVTVIIGMQIYGLILRFALDMEVSFLLLFVYAVLGNIATQLGDLAFSLIKREHETKDYGDIIPGNGGMMDRFDSMVFAAPIIYILVRVLPAF
ncbi:MAG: phosphatidate cytidylyltransferase [Oscillospiraceae bacterium]